MNEYRHVNEITELSRSRIRWMAAAYIALALLFLTIAMAWRGMI